MSSEKSPKDGSGRSRREPYQVRLPGFINDKETGLGDVVKRATSLVGIRPCGGCIERARRLNSWLVLTGRKP
jgi:hypothetical protein